jgi:osmotically-inducible protein OsmY
MKMKTMKVSLLLVALLLSPVLGAAEVRETPELEHLVRQDLLTLPGLSVFDNLTFRVYGLTVFLEGQVTSPTLKNDAEGIVRRINGVEGVNNRIEVLNITPSDEAIRMATMRAVYGDDPSLTQYSLGPNPPIHIVVRNGYVMLEGVVHNEVARSDAYAQAVSVPGVLGVTNELQLTN